MCPVCGEPCKRSAVAHFGAFVFVGDGFSDRCVALAADGTGGQLAAVTEQLLADPSQQAVLGERAAAIYRNRFSITQVVDALRAAQAAEVSAC